MAALIEQGRVLVVDDVESNRILARAYLELLAWTVDESVSALTTLDYLRLHTPEYILLDIRMPEVDGIALATIIRQKFPVGTIKIIAYTAHALDEEVARIRTSGFDDVLIKPVSFADISQIFQTHGSSSLAWGALL